MLFTSCRPNELIALLPQGEPSFRAKQIFKALYAGATTFDDITTLSKELRATLSKDNVLLSSTVDKVLEESESAKLLVRLADGLVVETVLLRDKAGRQTACVSCQVGCAMACAFCKTGTLGLKRNLEAGEIIEQFLHLQHRFGSIDNVVYMGMGEPLNNLEAVLKSIDLLSDPAGLQMSVRRFTISTCGLAEGIKKLAECKPEVRLAFSLVTADPALRLQLMPSAKANSLEAIKEALLFYQQHGGRRITLEAALLAGQNMRAVDAKQMIAFAQGLDCMVNVIPWNSVEGLPFTAPSDDEVEAFIALLRQGGLTVEKRFKKGATIGGACGQLGSTMIE